MAPKTTHRPAPPARTYKALVAAMPPRPLHDQVDYDNAVEMIGNLVGFKLNAAQQDYLEAITTFIEKYEAEHPETQPKLKDATPGRLLQVLMDQHGLTTFDIAAMLGVDRSMVSHLTAGKRKFTWSHAKALAEHFALDPAALME